MTAVGMHRPETLHVAETLVHVLPSHVDHAPVVHNAWVQLGQRVARKIANVLSIGVHHVQRRSRDRKTEYRPLRSRRGEYDLPVRQVTRFDVVITQPVTTALVALNRVGLVLAVKGQLPEALAVNSDLVETVRILDAFLVGEHDLLSIERKIKPPEQSAVQLRRYVGHLAFGAHRAEYAEIASHLAAAVCKVAIDMARSVSQPLDEQELVEVEQRVVSHYLAAQRGRRIVKLLPLLRPAALNGPLSGFQLPKSLQESRTVGVLRPEALDRIFQRCPQGLKINRMRG